MAGLMTEWGTPDPGLMYEWVCERIPAGDEKIVRERLVRARVAGGNDPVLAFCIGASQAWKHVADKPGPTMTVEELLLSVLEKAGVRLASPLPWLVDPAGAWDESPPEGPVYVGWGHDPWA